MKTHGKSNHRIYKIFYGIKNRCYNINDPRYKDYGGRGITICDEWLDDFMSFFNWANSNGYDDDLSIDRIDNDGNYEPDNCRWATREVQARNTKKIWNHNSSGYRGVAYCRQTRKWKTRIVVNNKAIWLGRHKTAEDAGRAFDKYVIENNLEHATNFN